MRSVSQELREAGQLFAKNPGLVFFTVLVVGLAVSSLVAGVCRNELSLARNLHISGIATLSRSSAVVRGARFHGVMLRMVASPQPPKKHRVVEKPAAPRGNAANSGAANSGAANSGAANSGAATRPSCVSLSDLRFPEFNFLIPPL